jgi:hypothetical protein
MSKTLERIPISHYQGSGKRVKPEMIVHDVSRRLEPRVILAKAKEVTCARCIYWSGHSPPGPCGGFTRATVVRRLGDNQDIRVTAGDGYVKDAAYVHWAQEHSEDIIKLCAADKTISV